MLNSTNLIMIGLQRHEERHTYVWRRLYVNGTGIKSRCVKAKKESTALDPLGPRLWFPPDLQGAAIIWISCLNKVSKGTYPQSWEFWAKENCDCRSSSRLIKDLYRGRGWTGLGNPGQIYARGGKDSAQASWIMLVANYIYCLLMKIEKKMNAIYFRVKTQ